MLVKLLQNPKVISSFLALGLAVLSAVYPEQAIVFANLIGLVVGKEFLPQYKAEPKADA